MTGVQLICEGTGPLVFAQLIHMFWLLFGLPGLAYALGLVVVACELCAVYWLPPTLSRGESREEVDD